MHIKQVVISGFRSFRSQSEIEPFSPRHNVIVGRNGSGKSNFFDAIQFVLLNQRFSSLRQEERQVLLHEGAGANVLTAFVELIFDNSDGRLAQDGDEVVLRRTIGLKKDEFFLNRKRVTKQEVSSLLESAGFSKSNPYYIVQQGKVSTLTLMKDAERLNLLKEVAGTKVYEERRQESLKIMEELKNKFDKIQEVISFIEERLGELKEEKEELGAYQKHDKEKRALEYTLYDKELTKARESLQDKDRAMDETQDRMRELHMKLQQSRAQAGDDENILADGETALSKLNKEVASKEAERRELLGVRAKLELEVKDLSERVAADGDEQEKLGEELKVLEASIAARRNDLNTEAGPAYEKARAKVSATEAELAAATSRREELYAKQSRGSKYNSAAERDAALVPLVESIRAAAKGKSDSADSLRAQAAEAAAQLERQKARAAEMEQQLQQRHAQSQHVSAELVQKTAARNDLAEERKDKWRALEGLQDRIEEQKNALEKSERDLRFAMPRSVSSGLDAVERLVKEQRIEGYYGPVFDNFVLRGPQFVTAVEVAGGNSVFNVIVDTDDTAAKLMNLLEKRKLGRVTFMPLNKLNSRVAPRKEIKKDVVYLIERAIKFRPEVKAAMEQIFGKKLLAKDLETASKYSEMKECDMDVLTMDGDEFNRKGGISGGYRDERSARLLTLERIRELQRDLKDLAKDQKGMQAKASEADQAVTNLLGETQKLEAKRSSVRNVMAQMNKDLGHVKRAFSTTTKQLQQKEERLEQVRREAEQELAKAEMLAAEIGTPLRATLTDADQRMLHELNTIQAPALNDRLAREFDALEVAAEARTRLKSILSDNLEKRREEVRELLDPERGGIGGSVRSGEAEERLETLAQRRAELSKAGKSLNALRTAVESLQTEASALAGEVAKVRKDVDKAKADEETLLERLNEETKLRDKLQSKQAVCITQLDDNQQKMQGLGTLPHDQHEKYKAMDTKKLMKKLNAANEHLKKFSHVNKKALDQYVSFSDQRETILERKEEIDTAQTAIKELIDGLDLQKDEAILRTFRGVSQNFSEVFQELVPSGSGQMIIKTSADAAPSKSKKGGSGGGDDDDDDDDDDNDNDDEGDGEEGDEAGSGKKGKKKKGKGKAAAKDGRGEDGAAGGNGLSPSTLVSDFVGVQIKVSFAAAGETFLMSQLSGGQKAVVALALIFAIQRCDPAPFYLFDEIDQALDSSYRAAVASLIQRQAHSSENPTQFITTTFRPEMVAVASQCYGISHQNKVSNIHVLPREEALGFVANIMNEEEAVGVDLQQPASAKRSRQQQQGAGGGARGATGRRSR